MLLRCVMAYSIRKPFRHSGDLGEDSESKWLFVPLFMICYNYLSTPIR